MNSHNIHLLLFSCLILASCRHGESASQQPVRTNTRDTIKDTATVMEVPVLDTTIVLSGLQPSGYHGPDLTEPLAKKTLYAYFSRKGYFNADNLPEFDKITEADQDKLSVEFTELFLADLNGNNRKDAVITYWLTPPYANGHCWQPHKSIIVDTDKGYKITNEEFIPSNFAIDSVVNQAGKTTIYGYDYDCGNHAILKRLRVNIR